jgi:hypothetical protein
LVFGVEEAVSALVSAHAGVARAHTFLLRRRGWAGRWQPRGVAAVARLSLRGVDKVVVHEVARVGLVLARGIDKAAVHEAARVGLVLARGIEEVVVPEVARVDLVLVFGVEEAIVLGAVYDDGHLGGPAAVAAARRHQRTRSNPVTDPARTNDLIN